jgi:hypothetical protein
VLKKLNVIKGTVVTLKISGNVPIYQKNKIMKYEVKELIAEVYKGLAMISLLYNIGSRNVETNNGLYSVPRAVVFRKKFFSPLQLQT